jgi:hypothetical protein
VTAPGGAEVEVRGDRQPGTLVWIDARGAVVIRSLASGIRLERIESAVPPHHGAASHVQHDPSVHHGGGKSPMTAEPRRLEHLKRFVDEVSNRLEPGDALLILGPGTVHERLARHVAEGDAHHRREREIVCEASPPLTNRQLIARLRAFVGVETRQHTVGSYRWFERPEHRPPDGAQTVPWRIVDKPPRVPARRRP